MTEYLDTILKHFDKFMSVNKIFDIKQQIKLE